MPPREDAVSGVQAAVDAGALVIPRVEKTEIKIGVTYSGVF